MSQVTCRCQLDHKRAALDKTGDAITARIAPETAPVKKKRFQVCSLKALIDIGG
jgi:hypothetical protein